MKLKCVDKESGDDIALSAFFDVVWVASSWSGENEQVSLASFFLHLSPDLLMRRKEQKLLLHKSDKPSAASWSHL